MPRSAVDVIHNRGAVGLPVDHRADLDVEKTLGFKKGDQVSAAFIDQVLVDRIFLKNRHQFMKCALRNFCSHGAHGKQRSALHLERDVGPVGIGMVIGGIEANRRREPSFVSQVIANVVGGLLQPLPGIFSAGLQ